MDLENFENTEPVSNLPSDLHQKLSAAQAVEEIDRKWYYQASRSARWMDLLGDYAGIEPFVIDGKEKYDNAEFTHFNNMIVDFQVNRCSRSSLMTLFWRSVGMMVNFDIPTVLRKC